MLRPTSAIGLPRAAMYRMKFFVPMRCAPVKHGTASPRRLPAKAALNLKPTLYNASADVMLAVLRHATGDTVMMIGHNPGIAEFAHRLVNARAR